jgi:hypothetical protein
LKRKWIGIDITHLAIGLIRKRLRDVHGSDIDKTYEVIGEPTTEQDAQVLAAENPYQFQWWALDLVGASPAEKKKGADQGIDGRLFFHDDAPGKKTKQVIFSVKAGTVSVAHVRDLRGVIQRENADIGALLSMQPPTAAMRREAASAGFYVSPWGGKYPRLQLLTVGELLSGRRLDYPAAQHTNVTFRKARKAKRAESSTSNMFD